MPVGHIPSGDSQSLEQVLDKHMFISHPPVGPWCNKILYKCKVSLYLVLLPRYLLIYKATFVLMWASFKQLWYDFSKKRCKPTFSWKVVMIAKAGMKSRHKQSHNVWWIWEQTWIWAVLKVGAIENVFIWVLSFCLTIYNVHVYLKYLVWIYFD